MEILTLLRLNGKRLTALAIVGALTAALAAAAVNRRPGTFEASTTVFVSQALPKEASAFEVGPLVSDFQKAVTLPQVRQAAADKLQLSLEELLVEVSRNGTDGGSVEVVATAPNARDAEAISQTVSTEGMRFLAAREVERAANIESLRQTDVNNAREARDELVRASGSTNPVSAYQATVDKVIQLELTISDPTIPLTEEQKAAVAVEAARLRQKLPALQAAAAEYERALVTLVNAEDALKDAKDAHAATREVLAAATTSVAISAGETTPISNVSAVLQAVAAAVIATFIAGLAFFFLADSSRRAQRRKAPITSSGPAGGERPTESPRPPGPSQPRVKASPSTASGYQPTTLGAMEAAQEAEALKEQVKVDRGSSDRGPAVSPKTEVAARSEARPATAVSSIKATPKADRTLSADGVSADRGAGAVTASALNDDDDDDFDSQIIKAVAADKTERPARSETSRISAGGDTESMFTRSDKASSLANGEKTSTAKGEKTSTEKTSAVATSDEAEAEDAPAGAESRNRRSAANRRRLGN